MNCGCWTGTTPVSCGVEGAEVGFIGWPEITCGSGTACGVTTGAVASASDASSMAKNGLSSPGETSSAASPVMAHGCVFGV